ncbi:ATP-dependent DNA helicase RecQ, partial [Sorochytrium milnesiophthora]
MRRGRSTRANQQFYASVEPTYKDAVDKVLRAVLEYTEKLAGDKHWRGIVFRQSNDDVVELCRRINQSREVAIPYHGKMTAEQKQDAHRAWQRGKARVMVCTDGFGAGVDYAH